VKTTRARRAPGREAGGAAGGDPAWRAAAAALRDLRATAGRLRPRAQLRAGARLGGRGRAGTRPRSSQVHQATWTGEWEGPGRAEGSRGTWPGAPSDRHLLAEARRGCRGPGLPQKLELGARLELCGAQGSRSPRGGQPRVEMAHVRRDWDIAGVTFTARDKALARVSSFAKLKGDGCATCPQGVRGSTRPHSLLQAQERRQVQPSPRKPTDF
jgi:hypothetical protein